MTRLTISTSTAPEQKTSAISTRRTILLGGHRVSLQANSTVHSTIKSSIFSNRRVVGAVSTTSSSGATQFWS